MGKNVKYRTHEVDHRQLLNFWKLVHLSNKRSAISTLSTPKRRAKDSRPEVSMAC